MILGFKQNFPWGEPTNFREKILFTVKKPQLITVQKLDDTDKSINPLGLKDLRYVYPITHAKIHTMREDPHNRWKEGRSIQMVYRGPKYSILDHFNKDIPELENCKSTQKVEIRAWTNLNHEQWIYIDGKPLGDPEQYQKFFQNDGFKSGLQFVRWFKKPMVLKLIHWTDFRY